MSLIQQTTINDRFNRALEILEDLCFTQTLDGRGAEFHESDVVTHQPHPRTSTYYVNPTASPVCPQWSTENL
jgi:hypothetical protein